MQNVADRRPAQHDRALEHHGLSPDDPPAGARTAPDDLARCGFEQAVAQAQQQAFARAVRAENDGPSPGAQCDVDVVEQAGVTALEDQLADFQR